MFKQTHCIDNMRGYTPSGLLRKKEFNVIISCDIMNMQ